MAFRLEDFGVDLTAEARAGRLPPVEGREAELTRMIRVLARKTKNNPLLLGEPGVGKTAIVEALALRMVSGRVPPELAKCALFSLNLGSLLAGTGYRGDFEQRLRDLVAQLRRPGSLRVVFIDELHLLGRAGKSEGGLDAGNLLKPLLARGELPCIGASTPDEWNELLVRDPALERRFQPIAVAEPTASQATLMLRGLRPVFERHHQVQIADSALEAAIALSLEVMPGRRLPDRAVDVLDEACALLRLATGAEPTPAVAEAQAELLVAEAAFDLESVARLKFRVLPKLQEAPRPRLDAAGVSAACIGLRVGG